MQSADNAEKFITTRKIDSFERLVKFTANKEQKNQQLETVHLSKGQKLSRLKELSKMYALFAPVQATYKESQSLKGLAKMRYDKEHKDSVFLDLFQNKNYLLKLYRTLHPEDTTTTEDSLTDVTITNVLTDNLYNDLGFIVNNKLVILVEAQSTWTVNILVRVLLYLAQSYHEYFQRTCQDYYKRR